MRLIRYCIVTLLILFSFTGCSQKQTKQTDLSLPDIASAIIDSQSELPPLQQITPEDEMFFTWLSDYYFVQADQVADGIICYADGVEASEIAVLLLEEEKDCKAAEAALEEYIRNRAGVFEGYAPQQAALIKNGTIAVNGKYIALLICPDTAAAKAAFSECFDEGAKDSESLPGKASAAASAMETEIPAEAAAAEETYDSEAVLLAWDSGNDSSLSEINRCVLTAARNVIAENITDDMSDYEKELIIHDWITGWSSFDMSAFSRTPGSDGGSDSDNPYGVLIRQTGNCWGYSSTFQLFMDMLSIECMTVYGIPGSNGTEHAWNMVRLDGEWYCVDTAWDDPIGGSPGHTYFNVTSEYLRQGSIHRWDDASVPEAVGTAYAYGRQ